MIFFVGIILSALSYLFFVLWFNGYVPIALLAIVRFLGIFLTGWALLGYAVMKEVLPKQRLIAFLFAIVVLATLFTTTATFTWIVT
jgi:hypothetical protein